MEGFRIGERASVCAGELSLYVANGTGRLGLVRLAVRALIGHLDQASDFDTLCATRIDVQTRRARIRVATDGELNVMNTPLRFRVSPASLKVIVPRPGRAETA